MSIENYVCLNNYLINENSKVIKKRVDSKEKLIVEKSKMRENVLIQKEINYQKIENDCAKFDCDVHYNVYIIKTINN